MVKPNDHSKETKRMVNEQVEEHHTQKRESCVEKSKKTEIIPDFNDTEVVTVTENVYYDLEAVPVTEPVYYNL